MKPGNRIWTLLKSLPLIRLALAVGGAIVASIGAAVVQGWIQFGDDFPNTEAVWIERIKGAVTLGMICLGIVVVVMIALAFGQMGRFQIRAGPVDVDLDFDDADAGDDTGGRRRGRHRGDLP